MARRGPKGLSPEQKKARGTDQPCRAVVHLFPHHNSRPDPDVIDPPKGMTKEASRIWREKVDRYRQRGQKVQGYEAALRAYCELEAKLNAKWKDTTPPPMAMVNTYRMLAAEFFDTPASQKVPASVGRARHENKFANNGRQASA
jgi:hypothetical protein